MYLMDCNILHSQMSFALEKNFLSKIIKTKYSNELISEGKLHVFLPNYIIYICSKVKLSTENINADLSLLEGIQFIKQIHSVHGYKH